MQTDEKVAHSERKRLREQWRDVSAALGIEFVAPVWLPLPDGTQREFSALLPQFGSDKGMLVDVEYSETAFDAAVAIGYGVSFMNAETLPIDPTEWIDCLLDWGWNRETAAPDWYIGNT